MKRYRIANKFRFTIFVTVCVLLIAFAVNFAIGGMNAYSAEKKDYIEICVQQGDTLWDLARSYGPADRDVRDVIREICAVNDVSAYTLQSGQSLLIPLS